jgi:hypothetical protein
MTWGDLRHLYALWAQAYCQSPAYWCIDSRPVCSVLNLTDFEDHYGPTMLRLMLLSARKVVQETIGVEPYLMGVVGRTNPRNVRIANQLPLDGVTGYALLPNWLDAPVQQYANLIEQRVKEWYAFQERLTVPFFPVASAGWDATVRGERLPSLRGEAGFPWSPCVVGVTPALFGHFLDEAIEFNLRMHPEHNIVFIHAWNEWSESSAVEPSDRFGYAMLEEIRKRAGRFQAIG